MQYNYLLMKMAQSSSSELDELLHFFELIDEDIAENIKSSLQDVGEETLNNFKRTLKEKKDYILQVKSKKEKHSSEFASHLKQLDIRCDELEAELIPHLEELESFQVPDSKFISELKTYLNLFIEQNKSLAQNLEEYLNTPITEMAKEQVQINKLKEIGSVADISRTKYERINYILSSPKLQNEEWLINNWLVEDSNISPEDILIKANKITSISEKIIDEIVKSNLDTADNILAEELLDVMDADLSKQMEEEKSLIRYHDIINKIKERRVEYYKKNKEASDFLIGYTTDQLKQIKSELSKSALIYRRMAMASRAAYEAIKKDPELSARYKQEKKSLRKQKEKQDLKNIDNIILEIKIEEKKDNPNQNKIDRLKKELLIAQNVIEFKKKRDGVTQGEQRAKKLKDGNVDEMSFNDDSLKTLLEEKLNQYRSDSIKKNIEKTIVSSIKNNNELKTILKNQMMEAFKNLASAEVSFSKEVSNERLFDVSNPEIKEKFDKIVLELKKSFEKEKEKYAQVILDLYSNNKIPKLISVMAEYLATIDFISKARIVKEDSMTRLMRLKLEGKNQVVQEDMDELIQIRNDLKSIVRMGAKMYQTEINIGNENLKINANLYNIIEKWEKVISKIDNKIKSLTVF